MERIADFVISLGQDDQVRHRHVKKRGIILKFTVQYETWKNER